MKAREAEQKAAENLEKLTTEQKLEKLWKPIDAVGKSLMGSLWRDVYETVQDAIALCALFSIPGAIGKIILKEDYSGFDRCFENWNAWNVNRYACCVIVASGFILWTVVSGRIIARTINNVFKKKGR